jgi:CBS domain-containing protein
MRKMSDIVRNQDPVTLPPSATVREACQSMRDRRVGAVLVTEGNRSLVGIFTGRDAVHRVLAEGKDPTHTILGEVMTREPDTIPSGKIAIEALRLMEDGRYRHLPIVDDGRVVGNRFAF